MPLFDDGDEIRGFGFVAIYMANLEDEIDELIHRSRPMFRPDDRLFLYGFGQKIGFLKEKFREFYAAYPSIAYAEETAPRIQIWLDACSRAADARNELLHSPVYADMKSGRTMQKVRSHRKASIRTGRRRITSRHAYDLANRISSCWGVGTYLAFRLGDIARALPPNWPLEGSTSNQMDNSK